MKRILAAGLALLALAAWLRRPHAPPPPSRPFPLNGSRKPVLVDWLDETPVSEYRRRGAL
jgi:hypothetical protein